MLEKIKCICCGKEIERLDIDIEVHNPLQDMWSGGIIGGISANYGSIHDSDVFFIALCDKCAGKKMKEGSLIFRYNYMNDKGDGFK